MQVKSAVSRADVVMKIPGRYLRIRIQSERTPEEALAQIVVSSMRFLIRPDHRRVVRVELISTMSYELLENGSLKARNDLTYSYFTYSDIICIIRCNPF